MIDRVSLLKKFYKLKYTEQKINFMIWPTKTPEQSYIQKFINIETSAELKQFFKLDLDAGLELQMKRII